MRFVKVKEDRWVNFDQVAVIALDKNEARLHVNCPDPDPVHVPGATEDTVDGWLSNALDASPVVEIRGAD